MPPVNPSKNVHVRTCSKLSTFNRLKNEQVRFYSKMSKRLSLKNEQKAFRQICLKVTVSKIVHRAARRSRPKIGRPILKSQFWILTAEFSAKSFFIFRRSWPPTEANARARCQVLTSPRPFCVAFLPIRPLWPLARRVRASNPRRDRLHLKAARTGAGGTLGADFLSGFFLPGKCRPLPADFQHAPRASTRQHGNIGSILSRSRAAGRAHV